METKELKELRPFSGKRAVPSTDGVIPLDVHMQKDEAKLLLRPHKEINSKLTKALSIRAKTVRFFEENTEINLHNL